MLGILVYDDEVRTQVIKGQRKRVEAFGPMAAAEQVDRLIDRLS